ncbi:hypothetical protein ACTFIW_011115 [Dictyostelium discoideum]
MSATKKIKKYNYNNNKKFQDIIDFEIIRSIINYLLTSENNKTNNNNNTTNNNNKYKIRKFYLNRNEILNYILVSKKWFNFISLTISNNIINNKLFEHWLTINYDDNKSFIENNNNQNQYDKNNLIYNNKYINKTKKISFNKEFSIIKIKESIINDYFKFNLFLDKISVEDFKEIKNKFENNKLVYNRIVVNVETSYEGDQDEILFKIHKYVSNENSKIISNLFKILEINHDFMVIEGPVSKEEEGYHGYTDGGYKKCSELYLNSLSIYCNGGNLGEVIKSLKVFKIFKGKNIVFDGPNVIDDVFTYFNYSTLFDPDNSGQQVESIIVQNLLNESVNFVEARHLIKVNQFQNLNSIAIPLDSFQILSNLTKELGFNSLYGYRAHFGNSDNIKSELDQMINSFITSKSLKNLKITSISSIEDFPIKYIIGDGSNIQNFNYYINKSKESFSNSFQPLFSELNTSIERIEFDCCGLLNINTFLNLLNNKSIKYLYLYDSDFIVYSSKQTDGDDSGADDGSNYYGSDDSGNDNSSGDDSDDDDDVSEVLQEETISINQYLFENIFSSPLTSIRHYKICFKELKQLKFIFNLILNNIFKLQLYSLIFEFYDNKLIVINPYFKTIIKNYQQ